MIKKEFDYLKCSKGYIHNRHANVLGFDEISNRGIFESPWSWSRSGLTLFSLR